MYTPTFGTEVEYYDASGHAWLWFPGTEKVIYQEWRTEDRPKPQNAAICFKVPWPSYNPVTYGRSREWECGTPTDMMRESSPLSQRKGDVFNLSHRQTPPFESNSSSAQFQLISNLLPSPGPGDTPAPITRLMYRQIPDDGRLAAIEACLKTHPVVGCVPLFKNLPTGNSVPLP